MKRPGVLDACTTLLGIGAMSRYIIIEASRLANSSSCGRRRFASAGTGLTSCVPPFPSWLHPRHRGPRTHPTPFSASSVPLASPTPLSASSVPGTLKSAADDRGTTAEAPQGGAGSQSSCRIATLAVYFGLA